MIQIKSISEITTYMDDLQAIIFDLDDTLYPLETYVQSGFRQISRLFLGHGQEVYDRLWEAYQKKGGPVADAIHEMLQQNEMDTDELAEKCLRIYEQHSPDIQPYDGVVDLLKELREKGLRLGLLVDGQPEMQREKIRALGIVPLFDEIIITDDLAGHGDVRKFRTPNLICFEVMSLRLEVPLEKTGYVKQK